MSPPHAPFFSPLLIRAPILVAALLSLPLTYFLISYIFVAVWHRKPLLWNIVIHENGRLNLARSLFYFDHSLACVPMVALFALSAVGGIALSGPTLIQTDRAAPAAGALLVGSAALVFVALVASVRTVGWQRTADYALQRIERDGVLSRGGGWNQLQLSNIPIALGTVGAGSVLGVSQAVPNGAAGWNLSAGGVACLALAASLAVGISAFNWCGWRAFSNPRWLAHGVREMATHPLTGIPIALASVVLVESYLSGVDAWTFVLHPMALFLLGAAVSLAVVQPLLLRDVEVLALAQKPPFARNGLPVSYLLCAHVFEHFLDFVLIGPLTGGIYALTRV